jgi:hypothetical protein
MSRKGAAVAMSRSFDLMIVGVQKAGTTSLTRYLGQHPQIAVHKTREITYFVRDNLFRKDFKSVFNNHYPQDVTKSNLILGKSAGIAYQEKPAYRLKDHSPSCKILVVLREPVERAYSEYWFRRRMGREAKSSFEAALAAETKQSEDNVTTPAYSYLARGQYPPQIKRLWELFGIGNVSVFLLRDLKIEPVTTCQSIFEFTDIDSSFQPSVNENYNTAQKPRSEWVSRLSVLFFEEEHWVKEALQKIIPRTLARKVRKQLQGWNQTDFSPPPMKTDTRQALAEYFEPHNLELESMLGRSLDHWTRA